VYFLQISEEKWEGEEGVEKPRRARNPGRSWLARIGKLGSGKEKIV